MAGVSSLSSGETAEIKREKNETEAEEEAERHRGSARKFHRANSELTSISGYPV